MPGGLTTLVPAVHAGATWFMVGLIWFVQIVHYPLLGHIPADAVPEYARAHQRRTTLVVGPLMLIEAGSALLLLWAAGGADDRELLSWIGLVHLAVIWASTFAVQVPLHARLASGFDPRAWRRLVFTNWVRTIAWTSRGVIALGLME
ncbi:MAG: hypothetical protein SFY69_04785 [Planctomycetota bacterium]|nr:hypothetical protein [Planctomycetota bacterium]